MKISQFSSICIMLRLMVFIAPLVALLSKNVFVCKKKKRRVKTKMLAQKTQNVEEVAPIF